MYAENWPDLKELLLQALDLEPAARPSFIESIPAGPEVRRELTSLLSNDSDSRDFMSAPAASLLDGLFSEEEGDAAYSEIGPFRIVRELGIGGMGAVYLAERADGKFSQQVAVKLVKREFNATRVRAAFAREIDILSKLAHPNIARLLDTGVTDDGIPYLVMEYVDGLPIDRFCSEQSLSLTETLKLFNKVCEAVAYSHQNLIVHRDLKPSNILVMRDGSPKLLDFGISKLLDDSQGETPVTLLGAMTPEYASPEQVERGSVTTATDVYSLGVVLYKLLAAQLPLPETSDQEPAPPSRVAARAKSRFSASQLRGDLDNIVRKATDKHPEKRYLTIEQLREDIWRYVDGHPVQARRPTFSYRFAKSVRRYKVAAAAAVLVVVSLVGGASAALWQAREARAQAVVAATEADRARSEQQRSDKISKFMFRVLSYGNPRWYAEGARQNGQARVIDVIGELGDEIDKEFPDDPDIAAELHHQFCEIYGSSAMPDAGEKGLTHARRALELRRKYYGERHDLVAKDMFYFYVMNGVPANERPAYLLEALEMMRQTNPDNLNYPYIVEDYVSRLVLPEFSKYHEQYAAALPPAENKYQWSERMLREADRTFHLHYADDNPAIAANACRIAFVLIMQNRRPEAAAFETLCRESAGTGKIESVWPERIDFAYAHMPSGD